MSLQFNLSTPQSLTIDVARDNAWSGTSEVGAEVEAVGSKESHRRALRKTRADCNAEKAKVRGISWWRHQVMTAMAIRGGSSYRRWTLIGS